MLQSFNKIRASFVLDNSYAVFLLEIFIFISVNSQEVIADNETVTVVRGDIATLKWLLKKGTRYNSIGVVAVYLGERPNESALLFDSNSGKGKLINRFKSRLSEGTFTGKILEHNEVGYAFNITNVHYADNGKFYLWAPFTEGRQGKRVFRNATITLNVTGSLIIVDLIIYV